MFKIDKLPLNNLMSIVNTHHLFLGIAMSFVKPTLFGGKLNSLHLLNKTPSSTTVPLLFVVPLNVISDVKSFDDNALCFLLTHHFDVVLNTF